MPESIEFMTLLSARHRLAAVARSGSAEVERMRRLVERMEQHEQNGLFRCPNTLFLVAGDRLEDVGVSGVATKTSALSLMLHEL